MSQRCRADRAAAPAAASRPSAAGRRPARLHRWPFAGRRVQPNRAGRSDDVGSQHPIDQRDDLVNPFHAVILSTHCAGPTEQERPVAPSSTDIWHCWSRHFTTERLAALAQSKGIIVTAAGWLAARRAAQPLGRPGHVGDRTGHLGGVRSGPPDVHRVVRQLGCSGQR